MANLVAATPLLFAARNRISEGNELQCSAKHIFCISWLICQRLAGIQRSIRTCAFSQHTPLLKVEVEPPTLLVVALLHLPSGTNGKVLAPRPNCTQCNRLLTARLSYTKHLTTSRDILMFRQEGESGGQQKLLRRHLPSSASDF